MNLCVCVCVLVFVCVRASFKIGQRHVMYILCLDPVSPHLFVSVPIFVAFPPKYWKRAISPTFFWDRTRVFFRIFWVCTPYFTRFFWDRTSPTNFFEIGQPTLSDLRFLVEETSDLKNIQRKHKQTSGGSGPTPVARGGSGAKAPPLAARPALTPCHRRSRGVWADIQAGVFESRVFYW